MPKKWANWILIGLLSLIALVLIYSLTSVLIPFFIAALIAYFSNPLVTKLMRVHLSRVTAVSIVFSVLLIFIILFFILLIPLIQKQVTNFMAQLPEMVAWIKAKFGPWQTYLDIPSINVENVKNFISQHVLNNTGDSSSWFFKTALHSGKALFELAIYLILIPVVTFYFLRDWDIILKECYELIPRKWRSPVVKYIKECDVVLSAFFRGQLLVMLCLGIFYSIALTLIGIKTSIIIGLIVGLTSIVPYLGAIIGILLASLAALVQFGTFSSVLWVWAAFVIGHSIENFYLTPKLIGDRIGLHPVVVIFSILAGGTLFGVIGVLLALPVTAIAMVFLRHTHAHYPL